MGFSCAQPRWVVVFLVGFCVWVVVWGFFGCSCGCGGCFDVGCGCLWIGCGWKKASFRDDVYARGLMREMARSPYQLLEIAWSKMFSMAIQGTLASKPIAAFKSDSHTKSRLK